MTRASSPRIEKFRKDLASTVPCWPNQPAVKGKLDALSIDDLLRVYLNWTGRRIPARPRKTSFAPRFWDSPRAQKRSNDVKCLIEQIEQGKDLTYYLSPLVLTHGFVSAELNWEDKDFALNAYQAHHLHFKMMDARGRRRGSKDKELLYGIFLREAVCLLMVGDHQSFHDGSLEQAVLQLRSESDDWVLRGILDSPTPWTPKQRHDLGHHAIGTVTRSGGKVVVSSVFSGPGHSLQTSRHADRVLLRILEYDAKIDDPKVVQNIFRQAGLPPPDDPIFAWSMQGCDLLLTEERSGLVVGVVKGPL